MHGDFFGFPLSCAGEEALTCVHKAGTLTQRAPPLFSFWLSETGFLCIVLAVLDPILRARLSWNSEIHLPSSPKCWG